MLEVPRPGLGPNRGPRAEPTKAMKEVPCREAVHPELGTSASPAN